ncbi:MAG TPA: hypothetical protein VIM10_00205 [Actinopolymorphaceae bacterium]
MTIEAEPTPLRRRSLALCLVAGFPPLLDDSIVNVALTSIRTGLGASESAIQWIIAGYALAFGMFGAPPSASPPRSALCSVASSSRSAVW